MLPEHPPEVFHGLIERTLHHPIVIMIINHHYHDVEDDDGCGGNDYDGDSDGDGGVTNEFGDDM